MKLRHFTGSFLRATALLTTTLPAFAGLFKIKPGGVFSAAVVTPGKAIGNGTPSTSTPSNPVSNSEIQGLGGHQSWVNPNTLAEDPRALCSDVGLGNNTRNSSTKIPLGTSTSNQSFYFFQQS
ncbi:hypothetical protein [Trichormus azollae]|uniref:hypothetical protein n=1 Tax=Trichormus azollae TaxID=1164 RepID=UPI00325F9D21